MENIPPTVTEPPVKRDTSKIFGFLSFLLLIVLAIAIGILWQQFLKTQKTLEKSQQSFSTEQKLRQDNLKQEIVRLTQKTDAQQTQLSQMSNSLSSLEKRAPGDDRSWKIAEVVYLVRMANLQLKVQHDIPAALVLLKQAESRLGTFQAPILDNFHAALLKNISTLQIIPLLDVEAITSQLANLQDEVSTLSILVAPKPNTSLLEDTQHQSHKKWWQRAWDNIKASLQQLIIVRHQDEKIPALMSPEQKLYLQENLQLLLMQAQWALLNHNPELYQKNLKTTKTWVEKYYVQNSASTQEFLKQLETLMNQNISPPVPDLAQTLALIRA